MTLPRVLIVDDRANMRSLLKKVLRKEVEVTLAENAPEAKSQLQSGAFDAVLCDLRMPGGDGLEVLRFVRSQCASIPFILMTAFASVDTAVEAMRLGAFDYLSKPFEPEEARRLVLRAIAHRQSIIGANDEVLPGMLAISPVMQELAGVVRRFAAASVNAVILGETGTGKERIARALHKLSPRKDGRFVAVNCAAIPPELIESELFGYVKGAFTGALQDRKGLFEDADGGTLFLDEVGDLRPAVQAKLTRVLEERAIRRVGDTIERPLDVRIVAATHRDLESMSRSGAFREDLWYRLNVARIDIPPLRERREDIALLAKHFLNVFSAETGRRTRKLSQSALHGLESRTWPGNVRELRASVERAALLSDSVELTPQDFAELATLPDPAQSLLALPWNEAKKEAQEVFARRYLSNLLKTSGSAGEAAEKAGVERESFYRLLRRYNLKPPST